MYLGGAKRGGASRDRRPDPPLAPPEGGQGAQLSFHWRGERRFETGGLGLWVTPHRHPRARFFLNGKEAGCDLIGGSNAPKTEVTV